MAELATIVESPNMASIVCMHIPRVMPIAAACAGFFPSNIDIFVTIAKSGPGKITSRATVGMKINSVSKVSIIHHITVGVIKNILIHATSLHKIFEGDNSGMKGQSPGRVRQAPLTAGSFRI